MSTPTRTKPRAGGLRASGYHQSGQGWQGNYTSPLAHLLSRLEGVQRAGQGYRARCPACGGQSQKVSVALADNGAVLLHCFAGCQPAEVLVAVGLTLADLFPKRIADLSPQGRVVARAAWKQTGWTAALNVLAREAAAVLIAARMVASGNVLTAADDARLVLAIERIQGSQEVLT